MWLDIIWLIVGLVLILWGADKLTDGASTVARKWGMSDLVVGLTVVAFGTSAPELAISVISAISGNAGIAIGNVVGSNIFNVFVIIGVTALVSPIIVEKSILTKDIPLVIVASLALLVMGNSPLLEGGEKVLTRVDGLILLLFFTIFMRHTFSAATAEGNAALPDSAANPGDKALAENVKSEKEMPMWKALTWIVLGLAALVFGGDKFVDGASGVATAFGVSDAVIGLTIVAAGTSLPELAASVSAAMKGKPGMAIGNVIGSNIFNIFFVLGCSATILPLPFGKVGNADLLTMTVAAILFWAFGWWFKERTITRAEGTVLVLCYIAYIAYNLATL